MGQRDLVRYRVLRLLLEGQLALQDAAEKLGLSVRQMRRLADRVKAQEAAACLTAIAAGLPPIAPRTSCGSRSWLGSSRCTYAESTTCIWRAPCRARRHPHRSRNTAFVIAIGRVSSQAQAPATPTPPPPGPQCGQRTDGALGRQPPPLAGPDASRNHAHGGARRRRRRATGRLLLYPRKRPRPTCACYEPCSTDGTSR